MQALSQTGLDLSEDCKCFQQKHLEATSTSPTPCGHFNKVRIYNALYKIAGRTITSLTATKSCRYHGKRSVELPASRLFHAFNRFLSVARLRLQDRSPVAEVFLRPSLPHLLSTCVSSIAPEQTHVYKMHRS